MDVELLKKSLAGLDEASLKVLAATIDDLLFDERQGLVDSRTEDGLVCPRCGSCHTRKHGHDKDGNQRFRCSGCSRTFQLSTHSIFHCCKRKTELKSYLGAILEGLSVRKAAQRCGISTQTSFFWRHRILDCLRDTDEKKSFVGIVEADETYLPLSFKGNRSKSSIPMPRKPRRRGTKAGKRGLSKDKVCIPCVVDRHRRAYGVISNLGKVGGKPLHAALSRKIADARFLCTDGCTAYEKTAGENSRVVKIVRGEVKQDLYHIQDVNSFHSFFKRFLRPFNGVSTKYTNNYISWATWLWEHVDAGRNALNTVLAKVYRHTSKSTYFQRSPVPVLA